MTCIAGTPGPGAHVHIDNVDLSSWQAQVSGTKRWLLRPPPECWWACHGDMEAVVSPGDIIVVNTIINKGPIIFLKLAQEDAGEFDAVFSPGSGYEATMNYYDRMDLMLNYTRI